MYVCTLFHLTGKSEKGERAEVLKGYLKLPALVGRKDKIDRKIWSATNPLF